jgi:DNA-binding MurR/RpiR family transcriptional regulator
VSKREFRRRFQRTSKKCEQNTTRKVFLSFSRAVMREDDLVFFVSFYPSKILLFLSVCPF